MGDDVWNDCKEWWNFVDDWERSVILIQWKLEISEGKGVLWIQWNLEMAVGLKSLLIK